MQQPEQKEQRQSIRKHEKSQRKSLQSSLCRGGGAERARVLLFAVEEEGTAGERKGKEIQGKGRRFREVKNVGGKNRGERRERRGGADVRLESTPVVVVSLGSQGK